MLKGWRLAKRTEVACDCGELLVAMPSGELVCEKHKKPRVYRVAEGMLWRWVGK